MGLRVKFWGTRGSIAAPATVEGTLESNRELLKGFFKSGRRFGEEVESYLETLPMWRKGTFGGNTTCVEILTDSASVIVDAGTGLRRLGYELLNGPCGQGQGEVHLLFTHFHWDHIMGLPLFAPLFVPGNKIHMYAVQPETEGVVRTLFSKPFFPVPYENLQCELIYYGLEPHQTVQVNGINLTPYQLDHTDPTYGFRFEHEGKNVAYCVDTEVTRVTREQLGADISLYEGADMMVFDSQYTLREPVDNIEWGHASAQIGIDLAIREGIRKVVFTHFDPAATDARVAEAMEMTSDYYNSLVKNAEREGKRFKKIEWQFAFDGMLLEV